MHHVMFFPWFGFLFFLLIVGLIFANIFRWRRFGVCHRGGSYRALDILEKRFVNGEIEEVEFRKMKDTLLN